MNDKVHVLFSVNCHGKKTDQETQSQVVKLFQEMMHKDKIKKKETNPEKTNLLNKKHAEKKRRHYSGHRSKSEQKSAIESSCSEIRQYKEPDLQHDEYQRCRTQSLPFQGEKRESWWFCSDDKNAKKNKNDDTCSCVSCALKKLITSDFACVGFLALLFSLSVIVGFLLVYKCIPTVTVPKQKNDRLKRKIAGINTWGSFMPKSLGLRRTSTEELPENPPNLNRLDSDSELALIFDENKLSDVAGSARLRDFYKKLLKADADIRRIKKNQNTNNLETNSNQWKYNFHYYPEREKRSLKLKNPFHLFHFGKNNKKTPLTTTKVTNEPKPISVKDNLHRLNNTRNKTLFNRTGDSILFEKEQVLIKHHKPRKEKSSHSTDDSKSHEHELKHPFYKNTQRFHELLDQLNKNIPNLMNGKFVFDANTDDEKSLIKHPKRDEKATDTVTEKPVFEAVGKNDKPLKFESNFDKFDGNVKQYRNSFGSGDKNDNPKLYKTDFGVNNQNENLKANFAVDKDDKPKEYQSNLDGNDINVNLKEYKTDFEIFRKMRNGSPNLAGTKTNGYADFNVPNSLKREQASTLGDIFDVLLTISTLMIPRIESSTLSYPIQRIPNKRRLLQMEDEQKGIEYEDLREGLTENTIVLDDEEKQARKRRYKEVNPESELIKYEKQTKYHAPNINNPNWKGPMPLYPDEISPMVKSDPPSNGNKLGRGYTGKKFIEQPFEDESDTDYMENYSDFRYDRLVNLAQAYSDYGVLDGKKYAVTDRHDKVTDKNSVVGVDHWKRIVKRLKHDNSDSKANRTEESDGMKIQLAEDPVRSNQNEDSYKINLKKKIYKFLSNNIKLSNTKGPSDLQLPQVVTVSFDQDKKPFTITGMSEIPKQYNDYTKDIYGLSIKNSEKILKKEIQSEDKILSPESSYQNTDSYEIHDDMKMIDKRSLPPKTKLTKDDNKRESNKTSLFLRYFKSFKKPKDLNRKREFTKNKKLLTNVYNDHINDKKVFKTRSLKSFNDDDMSEANRELNIKDSIRKIDDKRRNLELLNEAKDLNNISKVHNRNNDQKFIDKISFKKRTLNSFNASNDFYDLSEANPRVATVKSKRHANSSASNNTNDILSEIFSILAEVFSKLDTIKTTEKISVNSDSDSISLRESSSVETVGRTSELGAMDDSDTRENTPTYDSDIIENTPTYEPDMIENALTDESDAIENTPAYDSDTIENIGHISRVLLAINSTDENKLSSKSVEDYTAQLTELNNLNSTSSTPRNIKEESKKRAKVKRNAKNTIFWNDIYDDEYGVKTDMLDNLREKSGKHDFIKRSNDWIQDKVRRFGGNIFRGYGRKNSKQSINLNRRVREAVDINHKNDFNALTEHMKEVCQKAVIAVRYSRHGDLLEENKETNVLMKQLVGLMSDLIDYQVQQKTCMKLPQDLHNFLEWLTDISPDDHKDPEAESKPYSHDITENQSEEKSTGPLSATTSEREQPVEDNRSDTSGTLKTVQELLDNYDNMLDEDKSKMTGVKEYLLNQMKFLKSQLPSENVNKMDTFIDPDPDVYRYKRQLDLKPVKRKKHSRFLKNYSKKHTKTTANPFDMPTFTENFGKIKEKRNLRDVYYKAVLEAKKTTLKNEQNGDNRSNR